MTREERERVINYCEQNLIRIQNSVFACDMNTRIRVHNEKITYITAIDALRGPIPDPETGLVNCGCGKPAKRFTWDTDDDCTFYSAGCSGDCPATTDWQESQDDARKIWNKMMGYKEEE